MSQIRSMVIEILERDVPQFEVLDRRGRMGGSVTSGLLRLRADDGREGHCFLGTLAQDPAPVIDQIDRVLRSVVVGMEESDRERLRTRLAELSGHGPTLRPGWACVDVALWDLAGKGFEVPVAKLLGVARRRIPAYATQPPVHDRTADLIRDVVSLISEGFGAYKIHPGPIDAPAVAERVTALRDAVGTGVELMLDPNNGYGWSEALSVGRCLDDADFAWFEDPIPAGPIDRIVDLARRIDTPVAVSDALAFSLKDIAQASGDGLWITRSSARWQGITGLRRASAVMEASGGRCEIGLGGNPHLDAANLHVALSVPNCRFYEHWLPAEVYTFGVVDPIMPLDGNLHLPSGPGLGLILDEEWIARHRVATL